MSYSRIHLVVEWPGGRRSDVTIDDVRVTPAMLETAEDLLHTLMTGERVPAKGLYEACASAFGTSRDEAKKRLTTALYGGKPDRLTEPMLIGWTWKAHLDGLYADVRAGKWLQVSRTLTLMLGHALDKIHDKDTP